MAAQSEILPRDEHNRKLLSHVHPSDWVNPKPARRYNLVVVGAGTAGLVSAAGAAGLGARVALIERHLMGGDCLNVGCVPSKALIRSSRTINDIQEASRYGIQASEGQSDFAAVMERLRRLRASISHHDSVERFSELGIDVFLGDGRFTGKDRVEVDGQILYYKKAVIATGGRAVKPPIEGLAQAGFRTNETIFELTELPARLAVIGGGPIGCELAQAFCRLGSSITLIEMQSQFLSREDPDAAELLRQSMLRDGVDIRLKTQVNKVSIDSTDKILHLESENGTALLAVDEILVGAGRIPNVETLNLEAAGIEYDLKQGVQVNDYLQTTNPSVFAAGDVTLAYKFTHTADASARIVIQNALFKGRKKASALTIPWCTYTSPEIAHVGMYAHQAEEAGIPVQTFRIPFEEVDRAILEGQEAGFVKIHVRQGSDEILGATIVAEHAGEMISEITLAIVAGIGLGTVAGVIHPYPTQAEAIRKAADAYNRTRLTPFVKRLFNTWLSLSR